MEAAARLGSGQEDQQLRTGGKLIAQLQEKDKKIKNNISAWPYNFEVESPYVIDECVNIASQIILKLSDLEQKKNIKEQGAVLVFLPGEAEIARVKKCFHEISKNYHDLANICIANEGKVAKT